LQDGQYLRPSDPAYEQVLDSLAMIARHTPVPLLEALLRWRESESPKGANDASTFQRKLAVECIFCSACIRFVECCPQEGLTGLLVSLFRFFSTKCGYCLAKRRTSLVNGREAMVWT
jgi:hypothetical protein